LLFSNLIDLLIIDESGEESGSDSITMSLDLENLEEAGLITLDILAVLNDEATGDATSSIV